jgi:hypothetical protein
MAIAYTPKETGFMYSYVMLCAIRDALECHIKSLHLQGGVQASDSSLTAAQAALALTRSQIGSHIAENAGKVGTENAGKVGTPADVPPEAHLPIDRQAS